VSYEVSTRLCAHPVLSSDCFGARKSLHIKPVAPGEAHGYKETEGSYLNGRGPKRLGGGRSGGLDGCVAGSYTARRVFVSVLLCVIIVYIIVIWYILCIL